MISRSYHGCVVTWRRLSRLFCQGIYSIRVSLCRDAAREGGGSKDGADNAREKGNDLTGDNMKIAIASCGKEHTSMVDPRFGRAAYFLIHDTASGNYEIIDNSAGQQAAHGAGVQAAQIVAKHGVEIVVAGAFGPKVMQAFSAGSIRMIPWSGGTVADAVERVATEWAET